MHDYSRCSIYTIVSAITESEIVPSKATGAKVLMTGSGADEDHEETLTAYVFPELGGILVASFGDDEKP
jgi:hypothetical protein